MTDLTASALLEAFMTTPYLAESGQCDNILSDYAQDGPSDEDGPELMDLHRNSLSQHMSSKNIERTQEETVDEEGEDWSAYDDDTRTIDKEVSMLLPSTLSKKEEIKKVTPESAKGGERWWRSKKTETLNEMSTGITKKRLPCNVNIFYDGIDTLPNQLYLTKPTPRNSESQGEFEEEGEEINEDGTPACSVTNALRVASSPCSTDKTVDDDVRMNSPECNYKSNKMLSISRRVLALSWDEDDEQLSEVQLCIFLVDGGSLTVKARTEDRAHSVLSAAALRLGLAAEHVSALALYAVALDGNPEHRFVPGTPVAALRWLTTKKKSHKLVLAARLLTPQLLKVAARGFKREAPPNELALAKLLYAQAVARVMASNDSRVLPPLFPPLDTKNNNNLGEEKMFSQDDNEDTEWLRVDNYLRPRHDCPDRSEGLASALRLGALRLWARAVDACTLEPSLSIISAAVRLVRENGAIPFIPKLDSPEKDWHWETQLLEELDYLLKILNSQRIAKENRNISSNQATNINGEGITIEVFDSKNTLPESSGGTERYENSEIRTIFQVEPATPIISPRQSMTDEFSFLLPAACYLRLVSINYKNFGSVHFACCARRRASSEKMMETDPSSPVSAKELFSPNTEKDIPNDTTGYTANRTLSISANGIAISSSSSITPLLNVPFTKLRRWICDAQTNTVRLEAEEPFDPFDEAETSTSPGQANRLLNGLTSSSKTTHLKANERFANRTRRKLRKSIRAAASLPPPRTPRSQRMRDESTKKETAMESADITSVAHGGGFGAWARSLFSSNSPATKEESIGQKIHEALTAPENEEEDGDDNITAGLIDKDDQSRLLKCVVYELKLVSAETFANQSQTTEIISLLDDYFALELAEFRPRCKYESVFTLSTNNNNKKLNTTDSSSSTGNKTPYKKIDPDAVLGERPTVYKALVSAVVRPPRFKYDTGLLGPSSFDFAGRRIFRHDLILRNKDGRRIHCSHWKPVGPACGADGVKHRALNFNSPRTSGGGPISPTSPQYNEFSPSKTPCVIFMHANSASRVQATAYLSVVLSLGFSMFAFDCGGSGVSDGDFVSLGFHEAYDLLVVIAHLRALSDVGNIAVWGHSMGAAAVIYYQAFSKGKWPRLDACVLDSPYSDFRILANHLVTSNAMLNNSPGATQNLAQYLTSFSLFSTALQLVLDSIDASVQSLVGVSPLNDLSPVSNAHLCSAPALFLQARNDKIISMAHVEELANKYGGPRKLAIIDGTHSSPRNGAARKFVALYLKKHIKLPQDQRYPNSRVKDQYLDGLPWQSSFSNNDPFGQ